MRILTIDELPWEKIPDSNRKVFLRVDYNVPIKSGKILDDFRIRQTLPTIKDLIAKNCALTIASHLGRPEKLTGEARNTVSLLPIAQRLAELLDHDVLFSEETVGSGVRKLLLDSRPGKTIIVLENLRFDSREEGNDLGFAERLLEGRSIYVNDAFGASHRAHASIHRAPGLTKMKAAGRLLAKEWQVLNEVLHSPKKPQMAVLGGAKISDKILVIEKLMEKSELLCVGGRMGLTFLAAQGVPLGGTKIESEAIQIAKRVLGDAKRAGVEILLPIDGRAADSIEAKEAKIVSLTKDSKVSDTLQIFDIGPATLTAWSERLQKAKSVIWNGPMGVFENQAFAEGTLGLVDFFVSEKDKIQTTAGGGETVSAITQRGAVDQIYHVSTGGGAMLEFLEGKELPGFEALKLREREISEIKEEMSA